MPNFEGISKEQSKDLRRQTLESIEAGTAMPLPEFIKEDPEARHTFAKAIEETNKLRRAMSELNDEEQKLFLQKFKEILEIEPDNPNDNASVSNAIMGTLTGLTIVVGGTAAATQGNLGVAIGTLTSIAINIWAFNNALKARARELQTQEDKRQDLQRIKEFIIATAVGEI